MPPQAALWVECQDSATVASSSAITPPQRGQAEPAHAISASAATSSITLRKRGGLDLFHSMLRQGLVIRDWQSEGTHHRPENLLPSALAKMPYSTPSTSSAPAPEHSQGAIERSKREASLPYGPRAACTRKCEDSAERAVLRL